MDTSINARNEKQLRAEATDDCCRVDFIEIVPLISDTDGSSTTGCVSGDWSAEVKQENLAAIKQEKPDDVCGILHCIQFAAAEKKSCTDPCYQCRF